MTDSVIKIEALERVVKLSREYLQECYDNLPLRTHEQSLALACCGLVPEYAVAKVDAANPKAQAAWVLGTCWFLRMMYPNPVRRAGKPLYELMDELELDAPGDWASTHNEVAGIIRDSGHDIDDFRNL
ncbi:MAG: hypothetical protein EB141_00510 [Verrucomicrobia bacterium]|nr:hypothetical protein [Pseudomonadota bacterium]NDA65270.1 hypothetical protein [Verrucomicrobiota bacterium]NBV22551.1 hypothetical protein [Pseudomonadota bacterium]NDB74125.1 hypothetical protein [Verrucomicrobiota bacterium]NDD36803.1 hypothetical protein [Verrucomicrobiota bacterium]